MITRLMWTTWAAISAVPKRPLNLTHPHGQNGRNFADNIFICIFMHEKFCILIKISLKFVPNSPADD